MNYEDKPKLGTRVTSTQKMYKIGWPLRRWETMMFGTKLHGIYAGYRTLYDGTIERDYDEGTSFHPNGTTMQCALIITNERSNPIRVPFDGLELEKDDGEMH